MNRIRRIIRSMAFNKPRRVVVLGGSISGAACRVKWVDRQGQACATRVGQGAVGIAVGSEAFQTAAGQALRADWLAEWAPKQPCWTRMGIANAPESAPGWKLARPARDSLAGLCWWQAAQGLGVHAHLLGGSGVVGAWLSAHSLSAALPQRASGAADVSTAFVAHKTTHQAARRLVA